MQQERLLDLGAWLNINKEAIYGSQPYLKPYDEKESTATGFFDSIIDFNWVRNSPMKHVTEDNFKVKWEGEIVPKFSEKYTISCQADDYAIVYLNDKLIIDTRNKINSYDVTLKKGEKYSMIIDYVETDLEASISLNWQSKSQKKQPIKTNWETSYKWNTPYVCYTKNNNNLYAISFLIPKDNLILKLKTSPKQNMKITFLDSPQIEIPWQYKNGELLINTSTIHYSDVKSKSAYVFKLEGY